MHGFSPSDEARRTARAGAMFGIGSYVIAGLFPLYLQTLLTVPSSQIMAHRVIWSMLLLIAATTVLGHWSAIPAVIRDRRTLLMLFASALLISVTWLIYIWAAVNGHVLAASLGGFIGPLMNVILAVTVLRERLRIAQGIAVTIATIGVAAMALNGPGALWIPLILAITFALYGLVRKLAPADALAGGFVETMWIFPFALGWLLWTGTKGEGVFGAALRTDMLLIGYGVLAVALLLMFAAAAKRLQYATLGLLQYISPTMLFLQAALLFGEPVTTVHLFTFGCIWTALLLYAFDSLRDTRSVAIVIPPK